MRQVARPQVYPQRRFPSAQDVVEEILGCCLVRICSNRARVLGRSPFDRKMRCRNGTNIDISFQGADRADWTCARVGLGMRGRHVR